MPGTPFCPCTTDAECTQWQDADPCNGTLSCQEHYCHVTPKSAIVCPKEATGPCTATGCNPATAACSSLPLPEGTPCDDGNLCTFGDACDAVGACRGGAPACGCTTDAECDLYDDGDRCNGLLRCTQGQCAPDPTSVVVCGGGGCADGSCDPKTGKCSATPAPDGATCDDGNACTLQDACLAGACQGTAKDCDDGNACTTDACGVSGTCTHANTAGPCDDGDPCTSPDVCQLGTCAAGPLVCTPCTQDAECVLPGPIDLCAAKRVCVVDHCESLPGSAVTCPASDTVCQTSACVAETGQCASSPVPDGASCPPPNVCAVSAQCQGGACVPIGNACGCTPKNPLKCGDNVAWASDAFGATKAISAWPCAAGNFTGKEYAWVFKTDVPRSVTVKLSNEQVATHLLVLADQGDGCVPAGCIAADPTKVTFAAAPGTTYYLVVDGKDGASGKLSISVSCKDGAEVACDNGSDDDGDGSTDCEDADCGTAPVCKNGEICDNGQDDDSDGFFDCADPGCKASLICAATCVPGDAAYCGLSTYWATSGESNKVSHYSCSVETLSGPEFFYTYLSSSNGLATITVDEAFPGHRILVLQDLGGGCQASTCIASGEGIVAFPAASGATYFIGIDGASGASGAFHISMTCE